MVREKGFVISFHSLWGIKRKEHSEISDNTEKNGVLLLNVSEGKPP